MLRFLSALLSVLLPLSATAAEPVRPDGANWAAIEGAARGQTVAFHAWGGEPRVNDYIAWVGGEVKARFGITLEQVKLADTAEAVRRVLAEKAAGRNSGGAVDLVWINGENFAAMKASGLLFGPWAEDVPNAGLVDPKDKPATRRDFTVPTEGYELPWGMAQLVFLHDSRSLPAPPRSAAALLAWARQNPGRFTYPQPPDYLGSTFLKQVLTELAPDRDVLLAPAEPAKADAVLAPLWSYLDALRPNLWRSGRAYPQNQAELRTLLSDGEVAVAMSFDPADASASIARGDLPDTTRTFVFEAGTIANANFVAIPFNAAHKEGAMVVANFLLSPEAQARKQDPAVWGGFTVLSLDRLSPAQRALFDQIELGPATLAPEALGPGLPEPHPSWMTLIEAEWARRYGSF